MPKVRSSPMVYSKTRQPHMSGLPPCDDCSCECCCKEIVSLLSTDFLGAQNVTMPPASASYDFSGTDSFSIAFWVRYEDGIHGPAAPKSIVVSRTGWDVGDVETTGYSVIINSGGSVGFGLWGEARGDGTDANAYALVAETGTNVFAGAWTHVACTYDGSGSPLGMKVYVNGTLGTLTPSGNGVGGTTIQPTNNVAAELGREQASGGAWVDHAKLRLGEFAMFGKELTTEDIDHLCGSAYGALCNGPVQMLGGKVTCPGECRVWYRMGDDVVDVLVGGSPLMHDNGPDANNGTPAGFAAPGMFAPDAPPTCDCSGFGVDHVWALDDRNDYLAFIPAQTGVATNDPQDWASAGFDVSETESEDRLLFLNVDGTQPGAYGGQFADHSPNAWFGSVAATVHAASGKNAMAYLQTHKEIVLLNHTPAQLDVYWLQPGSRVITAKAAVPSFPAIADVTAIAAAQTQHPTTGLPGLIISTVGTVNPQNTTTFWYAPATDAWTTGPTVPKHMVPGSTVASYPGSTVTYFGIGNSHWIERYDSATSTWTTLQTPNATTIWRPGSSMAVDPATGDLWAILWNDLWQFWQFDVSGAVWVQKADPPTPFIAGTQHMHMPTDRDGSDFRLIVATFNTSKWGLYTPSTNTWATFRAPASSSGAKRWWKSGHLATIVPR